MKDNFPLGECKDVLRWARDIGHVASKAGSSYVVSAISQVGLACLPVACEKATKGNCVMIALDVLHC